MELYLQGGGKNSSPVMTLKHDQPSLIIFIKRWNLCPLSLGLGFISGWPSGYNEKRISLTWDPGFKQLLASTSFHLGCLLQENPCQRPEQAEITSKRTLLLCLPRRVVDYNMPAIKVETAWKGIQCPLLNCPNDAAKKTEQLCLAGPAWICRKNKWLLFEPRSL